MQRRTARVATAAHHAVAAGPCKRHLATGSGQYQVPGEIAECAVFRSIAAAFQSQGFVVQMTVKVESVGQVRNSDRGGAPVSAEPPPLGGASQEWAYCRSWRAERCEALTSIPHPRFNLGMLGFTVERKSLSHQHIAGCSKLSLSLGISLHASRTFPRGGRARPPLMVPSIPPSPALPITRPLAASPPPISHGNQEAHLCLLREGRRGFAKAGSSTSASAPRGC